MDKYNIFITACKHISRCHCYGIFKQYCEAKLETRAVFPLT